MSPTALWNTILNPQALCLAITIMVFGRQQLCEQRCQGRVATCQSHVPMYYKALLALVYTFYNSKLELVNDTTNSRIYRSNKSSKR